MARVSERLNRRKRELLSDPRSARRKLRRMLLLLYVLISVPLAAILYRTYQQLEHEALYNYRLSAEEVLAQFNQRLFDALKPEEDRPFEDYRFFKVSDEGKGAFQLSPLAARSQANPFPGLIGHFQIDPEGQFASPVFPDAVPPTADLRSLGITDAELAQRREQMRSLHQLLASSGLARPDKADRPEGVGRAAPSAPVADVANSGVSAAPNQVMDQARDQAVEGQNQVAMMPKAAESGFQNAPNAAPAAAEVVAGEERQAQVAERGLMKSAAPALLPQSANVASQKLEQRTRRKSVVNVYEQAMSASSGALKKTVPKAPETTESLWLGSRGKQARKVPDSRVAKSAPAPKEVPLVKVTRFEAEIDPFQMTALPGGKIAFFRKVWRDQKKFIQGFVVSSDRFFHYLAEGSFYTSALSSASSLSIVQNGMLLAHYVPSENERDYFSSREKKLSSPQTARRGAGRVVFAKLPLAAPLNQLDLSFSTDEIRQASGQMALNFVAAMLLLTLTGGFLWIYRLAVSQIEIAVQRNDFVSAVSHELKTPLTSIRMYAEMLKTGVASDPAKQSSYLDFILSESERLSRLISNVLQLARLSKGTVTGEIRDFETRQLLELIRAKVSSQVAAAGFELELQAPPESTSSAIRVEEDRFAQIFINLVDNALKFSAGSQQKKIEVGFRQATGRPGFVTFYVRDYGPGVPRDQMKKIFQLFYRAENEMTRKTPGTGIGLALVRQLADSLDGEVDLRNLEPGAEFQVIFPVRA